MFIPEPDDSNKFDYGKYNDTCFNKHIFVSFLLLPKSVFIYTLGVVRIWDCFGAGGARFNI